MKLIGYTCTYNEEEMIPYVMPYVERMGYDKFVVFDNESTDRTVELLSKYPFVEIRTFSSNSFGNSADMERADIHYTMFLECRNLAKIGMPDEEIVWMSWTDFDEVYYFPNDYKSIGKKSLYDLYFFDGFNVCENYLINLLPPLEYKEISLGCSLNNGLVHMVPNILCKSCQNGGNKCGLIVVNDFDDIEVYGGNHRISCKLREGKKIKPIPFHRALYFHLKYIDKPLLKEHMQETPFKEHQFGNSLYSDISNLESFDESYDAIYSVAYPFSIYLSKIDEMLQEYNYNRGLFGIKEK